MRLLDQAFAIPGTRFRVGLDGLLGLIPGVGDVAGVALSTIVLIHAARLGAPPSVLLRMLVNVAVDGAVGAIPVLGDLFDFGWKANTRNLRLLEGYLERPVATRSTSRAIVVGVAVAALLVLIGLIAGAVWLLAALISALG